ncbi:glucosyl-3-phosphoglycerate synthase [Corynebacterium kutscheri]|nr:glucosyl-3-phosphoglycerate synthase [Corynebacterium kutscheri]
MSMVSVVIPALNEQDTVADVVASVIADRPKEVLVIDADSTDQTARNADAAGARVINWREIIAQSPIPGKGESLWRGVAAARGEIIVFIDADIHPIPHAVVQLAQPFADPNICLVKADYTRGYNGQPYGGGRVTELTAKPLLRTFFPELAAIAQPLGGEYALRRENARSLEFVSGYGVEIGLLIDVYRRYGLDAICEVELGHRVHRNRDLTELSAMADVVAQTILSRAGFGEVSVASRPPLKSL